MTALHPAAAHQARDQWFDDLLAQLSTHRLMLETGTADKQTTDFYNAFIGGNTDAMMAQTHELTRRHFIAQVLVAYLTQLRQDNLQPTSLAFDLNDHEVLVWATIPDDDEALERALILAEAKVNARYHAHGYDLSSMIVELSDALPVPGQYTPFNSERSVTA